MDTEYKPNWSNGHVKKRVKKVLAWAAPYCVGTMGTQIPVPLSSVILNDKFGPKGNALGDYLRRELLELADASYSAGDKGYCRTYRLNPTAFMNLKHQLHDANQGLIAYVDTNHADAAIEVLVEQHANELKTKIFEYKDASDRLWHGLQNLPHQKKASFWGKHGLPWNYDIEACAPTILFQLARQAGLPDILLEALRNYLDDRSGFRQHVAALTGLDARRAKQLVNSLFNGAKLGKNTRFSSFRLLEYNGDAMDALKSDTKVQRLVQNIRRVWKRIENNRAESMRAPLSDYLSGNKQAEPWKLKSGRAKWSVYFENERRVLAAINRYLEKNGVRAFTEHDGFRTDREIDVRELERFIHQETGFQMKIEMEGKEE